MTPLFQSFCEYLYQKTVWICVPHYLSQKKFTTAGSMRFASALLACIQIGKYHYKLCRLCRQIASNTDTTSITDPGTAEHPAMSTYNNICNTDGHGGHRLWTCLAAAAESIYINGQKSVYMRTLFVAPSVRTEWVCERAHVLCTVRHVLCVWCGLRCGGEESKTRWATTVRRRLVCALAHSARP